MFKSELKKIPIIVLGNTLSAFAVAFFIQPAGLLAGGCTGIGLVLNSMFGIPVAAGLWAASIAFFLIGYISLGRSFAIKTLIGSITYPLAFNILSVVAERTGAPTEDILLSVVFAAAINGVGVGLLLRSGASSGGTDAIAAVLKKKFDIAPSISLNLLDGIILCLQMPFSKMDHILYSLIMLFIASNIIDRIIVFGSDKIQVQIHSEKYTEINELILNRMMRGSTLVHIQGGYTGKETFAVQTVITRRELFNLRSMILATDPQAFIVINPVSEVSGRGFTMS